MNTQLLNNLTVLQESLNEFITPSWNKVRTELDFMIATQTELAELLNSEYTENGKKFTLPWKWWKNASPNHSNDTLDWTEVHPAVLNNVKIELTDLLFFTLSQKLLGDLTAEDELVAFDDNDWANIINIGTNSLVRRPGASLQLVVELATRLNFNIAAYYVAKHTLNYIRQLNGYRSGTYQKVIAGREDNDLLHDIIEGITIEMMEHDFYNQANNIMKRVYDAFAVDAENRRDFTFWLEFTKTTEGSLQ